jgi:large subunit ribosomal protein L6
MRTACPGYKRGNEWKKGSITMSRIGKQPVPIPAKVEVTINGQEVTVKGPKGTLSQSFSPEITISNEDGILIITRNGEARHQRELHGLTRALVNNMVQGVTTGFRRTLLIEGVGYRAEMQDKTLRLFLGYSHHIDVPPPADVAFTVPDRQIIHIDGIDKALVGQLAANIRNMRPPEPYKGKGVRYQGEIIRRKAGKAGKGK